MKLKALRRLGISLMLTVGLFPAVMILACRSEGYREGEALSTAALFSKKDPVVLRVAGKAFLRSDFNKYVRGVAGQNTKNLEDASLSRLFDKFVEEKLLLDAAGRQNLTLSFEEKREYLARLRDVPLSGESRESTLTTEADAFFDKLLLDKYISLQVKDISVDDQEVAAYYEQKKSGFMLPERVKVSQILLKTEAKAADLRERLAFSPVEAFREIAGKESVGPEAGRGGEMGVFRKGDLPADMEKVIFSLRVGEVSPVLESVYGFHIFRLDGRLEPALLSLEEAAPSIRLKILDGKIQEAVEQHLRRLRESVKWTAHPQSLSFRYQRNIS